jgi:hypothetical protein
VDPVGEEPAQLDRAAETVVVVIDGFIRTEGYGYGWFIGSAVGEHRIFYHPGDNPGYRTINAWFPDDGVCLAVLSNEDGADLDPIVRDLIRTAFPEGAP